MNKDLNLHETFKLAIENHQKNKLNEAIDLYHKILQSDPNNSSIHYNLGLAFDKKKELNKAIESYKKVIEIDPNFLSAHFNLGVIFKELGDLENEINCYKKTLSIDPNHSKGIQLYKNLKVHQYLLKVHLLCNKEYKNLFHIELFESSINLSSNFSIGLAL